MKIIIAAAFVLLTVPSADAQTQAFKRSWWFKLAMACSAVADGYDGVSTAYVIGRENGRIEAGLDPQLEEGNDLAREAVRSPWRLVAFKSAGAVPFHIAMGRLYDGRGVEKPKLATGLLFANCAAKGYIGARNESLLRRAQGR